jgi:predicted RNA methylase
MRKSITLITLLPLAFALALAFAFAACDDIMAPDISPKRVAVISPADKITVTEGDVSFRWSAMEGADRYRVTVVSPGFAAARRTVRDTVLYQDSLSTVMSFGFNLTLTPADYEWSIQAFNHAYESQKSVYGLTVTPEPEPDNEEPGGEEPDEQQPQPETR